jgi:iron complex outermembrane recepter protein
MKRILLGLASIAFATGAAAQVADNSEKRDDGADLGEIVVTGTLIRGAGPTGSQLVTVDNAAIVASGTTNTADLLATVPALNSFNIAPQGGQSEFSSGGSSTPGLHGLPGTATLVLVDGHRLVGDTPLLTVPDPSSIPPDAIDHIEIVADGGSAIYGSDAVAGVINIILKKNFDGMSTTGSYGGANSYNTSNISQTFGKTWGTGSALVAATFENNSDLPNNARSFYKADLTPYGGTDTRTINCPQPNLQIGTQTYAPPYAFPGQAEKCDPNATADAYNQNRRYALMADARQDVGDRVHLSLDLKYTDDLQTEQIAGTALTVTVPNTNPYFVQPPGTTETSETALWNAASIGTPPDVFRSRSGMVDLGAAIDLSKTWQLSADVDYSWSTSSTLNPDNGGVNQPALNAALAGTTPQTALNPFGPGTSAGVASAILNWPLYFLATQKLYDVNVKADGSLFSLPGGDVKLAIGVGNRHEQYSGSDPIGIPGVEGYSNNVVAASRIVNSAFSELSIPIFGAGNELPGLHRLTMSIAARYDHYSDVGDTTNPKFGLSWSPIDNLTVRGSYGKSFHAPQLADLYGIDTRAGYIPNWSYVPPGLPPGTLLDGVYIAGGRNTLTPETAKTASFGVDFLPAAIPGLKTSVTYWMIRFNNEIEIPPSGGNELFVVPGLSSRFVTDNLSGLTPAQFASLFNGIRLLGVLANDPPPLVQQVIDLRRANIGSTDIDGWDFDFSYKHAAPLGTWSAGISGEYILKYESNEGAGTPFVNDITSGTSYQTSDTSAYNVIPWHVRATAGWQVGQFTTQAAMNYTGHYNFGYNDTAGGAAVQWVSPFVTVDLSGIWDSPAASGWAKNLRLQLNVYNVLDQSPPLVLQAGGYSPESANPLGRLVRFTVNKRW